MVVEIYMIVGLSFAHLRLSVIKALRLAIKRLVGLLSQELTIFCRKCGRSTCSWSCSRRRFGGFIWGWWGCQRQIKNVQTISQAFVSMGKQATIENNDWDHSSFSNSCSRYLWNICARAYLSSSSVCGLAGYLTFIWQSIEDEYTRF